MAASSICLPRFDNPTHPSTADWANFKELIIQLYVHDDKNLSEVQSYLRDAFNFDATPRMFKRHFTEWKVFKVLREQDAIRLEEEIASHRAAHNSSPVMLKVNGRFVDAQKVQRSLKRHRLRWRKTSNESAPPDLAALTPISQEAADDEIESIVSDESIGGHDCSIRLSRTSDGHPEHTELTVESDCCPVVNLSRHQTGVLGDLTSQELGSLSIAILQTDYHWGELQLEGSFNGTFQAFTSSAFGFVPSAQTSLGFSAFNSFNFASLRPSRELLDLESILYQSKTYYDNLASKRANFDTASYQCSCREAAQARDFYARYWLGLILGAGGSERNRKLACSLYDDVFSQTGVVLKEDHPHFLPWICFVLCYPRRLAYCVEEARDLQEKTLTFAQWMTESVGGRTDPRFIIQQKLSRSSRRRDIALVLLRQVIDTFRQQTQDRHLGELQLLAQLFDHIEHHVDHYNKLNEAVIEETLHQWVTGSLSIAKLIRQNELEQV